MELALLSFRRLSLVGEAMLGGLRLRSKGWEVLGVIWVLESSWSSIEGWSIRSKI